MGIAALHPSYELAVVADSRLARRPFRGPNAMIEDPLDKTTSIGAELTESGLNVNAKSRTVAAIDRLVGNAVDFLNLPVERRNVQERTRIEGERRLVEAIRDGALERMKMDPAFADRVTQNYLRSLVSRQENKDSVARHAIEDLRGNPQAKEAGPELDPDFVNRLERHAEDASTEALREKWGRVLAAEIRSPGTISPRVMRIVDEIDGPTAQLFEAFCSSRLANVIPRCLHGKLKFDEAARLEGAGLIVGPGVTGEVRWFIEASDAGGRKAWFMGFDGYGLSFPYEANLAPLRDEMGPLQLDNNVPVIPVYVLTDEGRAVSQILPELERTAFEKYVARLQSALPELTLSLYRSLGDGTWEPYTVAR
jgi:hypothetical protein